VILAREHLHLGSARLTLPHSVASFCISPQDL
jgi:hypothetical protein